MLFFQAFPKCHALRLELSWTHCHLLLSMERIEQEGLNLNISRHISSALPEERVDLAAVNQQLVNAEKQIVEAKDKQNAFRKELGLPLRP